jgi:hypothetical protein
VPDCGYTHGVAAGEFVERSALRAALGGLYLLRRSVSAGGRPICCPWALARLLPSAVRVRIRSRSTSARPPRTAIISRPVLVPVSAHGSARERNCALASTMHALNDAEQIEGTARQAVAGFPVVGAVAGLEPAPPRPLDWELTRRPNIGETAECSIHLSYTA